MLLPGDTNSGLKYQSERTDNPMNMNEEWGGAEDGLPHVQPRDPDSGDLAMTGKKSGNRVSAHLDPPAQSQSQVRGIMRCFYYGPGNSYDVAIQFTTIICLDR